MWIDSYYETIKAKRAVIVMPVTNKPWNMLEMRVKDPAGYLLRMAHAMECEPKNEPAA